MAKKKRTCGPLKWDLFARYGHKDKRVSNARKDYSIRVDDRGPEDVPCYFCNMFVSFPDPGANEFVLSMTNVPHNSEVAELVQQHGGTSVTAYDGSASIELKITPSDRQFLRRLARAINGVVARGQTYPQRNWKWSARRTWRSLNNLANNLAYFQKYGPYKYVAETTQP